MKKRHVLLNRDAVVLVDVPETWIVCNAPRPLLGHAHWTGQFITGLLYVAIDPTADNAAEFVDYNTRQDAREIVFHDEGKLFDAGLAWYRENYAAEIEGVDLDDTGIRTWIVERELDRLNGFD